MPEGGLGMSRKKNDECVSIYELARRRIVAETERTFGDTVRKANTDTQPRQDTTGVPKLKRGSVYSKRYRTKKMQTPEGLEAIRENRRRGSKTYREKHPEKVREMQYAWRDRFKKTFGIDYAAYRRKLQLGEIEPVDMGKMKKAKMIETIEEVLAW